MSVIGEAHKMHLVYLVRIPNGLQINDEMAFMSFFFLLLTKRPRKFPPKSF